MSVIAASSRAHIAPTRTADTLQDTGKLLLRLTLGLLMLLHGIAKVTAGIDPILGGVDGRWN